MDMYKIYELLPQMKTYSELGHEWKPFIMNTQESKFRSNVVNTDNFGLRFNDQKISNSIFDKKNILKEKTAVIIGASTVFGVGCTQDKSTISSFLTNSTDTHFYNIGARAYSGFQEITLFNSLINDLKTIDQIIIFSGVNDIFMNNYINNYDKILGPMFFESEFKQKMLKNSTNWKERFIQNFYQLFLKSKPPNEKNKPSKNEDILKIIKRNLICWSNVKYGMKVKLTYFLQPMANWCKKELSDQEKIIFNELNKSSVKTNECLKYLNLDLYYEYKKFLSDLCKELGIDFFDCNDYFSNKEFDKKWLFVDRIHLTDLGNKLISKYIKSKI